MHRSFTSELVDCLSDIAWGIVRWLIGFILFWLLVWLLFLTSSTPYGMYSAGYDFLRGQFNTKFPGGSTDEYEKLLKTRYNVNYGYSWYSITDMPPTIKGTYDTAYHNTMCAALVVYYGKDIFAECTRDSIKLAAATLAARAITPSPARASTPPVGPAQPYPYVKPTNPPTVMELRSPTPPRRQRAM